MIIYCIYCDQEKEDKWFTTEMQDLAKVLTVSKKDMIPSLACRKCLGYRVRSVRRKAKITYQK